MGCESSNLVEVIPVEAHEIQQNHLENTKEQHPEASKQTPVPVPSIPSTPNGKNKDQPNKENKMPEKLSIKLVRVPAEPNKQEPSQLTKRKSRSEYRIAEDLMNDTTNIQKSTTEEKKKSLIIFEKNKTFSAKQVNEKVEPKPQQEEYVGPSTHTIPDEKAPSKDLNEAKTGQIVSGDLMTPIVVQKHSAPEVHFLAEEPQMESLSEQLKSERSGKSMKSFKFEVYVESSAEILSKTQKFNKKLQLFIEKEEVAKYLQMIEYGEKEEILGKIYEQLQKKEEWNDIQIASSRSCEPLVVVLTEHGVAINHD